MICIFKLIGLIIITIHAFIGIKHAFNHFLCALVSIYWFKKTKYPIDKENFQHHISLFGIYVGGLIFDGFIVAFFIII